MKVYGEMVNGSIEYNSSEAKYGKTGYFIKCSTYLEEGDSEESSLRNTFRRLENFPWPNNVLDINLPSWAKL